LFGDLQADNDDNQDNKSGEYTRWHAAVDITKRIVNKLSPGLIASVLMTAVVVGGIAWSCVKFHEADLNHQLEGKKEANAQQLRIAEFNQRSITGHDGQPAALTSEAKQALAREDALDLRQVALLNQMELEYPLVRFVSAESLDGVAAALDTAPQHGKVLVNGAEMQGAIARAAAKQLRKSAKARRDNKGWITEIIPSKGNSA
jgi:hypothetical protein